MSRLCLDLSWEGEAKVETESRVRCHRNRNRHDDDRYLWFSTYVRPSGVSLARRGRRRPWSTLILSLHCVVDVVEATEHQTKYEYTVTGRRRIKPGSKTTTLGSWSVSLLLGHACSVDVLTRFQCLILRRNKGDNKWKDGGDLSIRRWILCDSKYVSPSSRVAPSW